MVTAILYKIKHLKGKNTHITDIKTAALVKYSENFFLGMKVSYFNELYEIHKRIKSIESSFDEFRALSGADQEVGHALYTPKLGWDDESFYREYCGHCLDKDNYEFMKFSQKHWLNLYRTSTTLTGKRKMKVPNWQHHSKKEKKRTLKPQMKCS